MAKVYHPKPSNTWWNRRWPYRIFMLRELSAVFAAIYLVLFLLLVDKVRNPSGFADYLDFLQNPVIVLFHIAAFLFALLHTVTWFQAVPKAMVVKQGGERVPDRMLIGGVYAVWAVASLVVIVIFLA